MKTLLITTFGLFAILFIAGLVYPVLAPNSAVAELKEELPQIELAFEKYKSDFGRYPDGDSSEIAHQLIGKNSMGKAYFSSRSTVEGFILDPWGRPYRFSYSNNKPVIQSPLPDQDGLEEEQTKD